MERNKLSAGALLAAALIVGGALGAAGHRWVARGEECRRWEGRGREGFVDWLSGELELSPEQRDRVTAVLERQHEATTALWREVKPRAEEIRRATWQEVRSILTPEQQERHAALLERIEQVPHKIRPRRGERKGETPR